MLASASFSPLIPVLYYSNHKISICNILTRPSCFNFIHKQHYGLTKSIAKQ